VVPWFVVLGLQCKLTQARGLSAVCLVLVCFLEFGFGRGPFGSVCILGFEGDMDAEIGALECLGAGLGLELAVAVARRSLARLMLQMQK